VWKSEAEKRIRQAIIKEIREACGDCQRLKKIPWYRAEVMQRKKGRKRKVNRMVIK
jgi:hypothetical protein